jgi:uncharacterized membrane protein YecN with MAPEG domain
MNMAEHWMTWQTGLLLVAYVILEVTAINTNFQARAFDFSLSRSCADQQDCPS